MGDKQEVRQFIKIYYFPIQLYTYVTLQLGEVQGKELKLQV